MGRFGAISFLSAALLFGLQPLMGRYALPWFGGAPAMWTACLLFFQAALLAGYGYAHLLQGRPLRRQAQVHAVMLALAVAWLIGRVLLGAASPIAPSEAFRPSSDAWLNVRVVLMLGASIGLPFMVLSATAPLLQVWFAAEHPGQSPYRLYAISNAGSFLSLLAQPFVAEPLLTRSSQGWIWSAGFVGFAAAAAITARRVSALSPAPAAGGEPVRARTGEDPRSAGGAFGWVARSFVGAVLLAATTQQLSNEVTAGPYLWVLPLGLYLLTFVLCFERAELYRRRIALPLWAAAAFAVRSVVMDPGTTPLVQQVLAYGAAVFAGCFICHGELYRSRPGPSRLSAFYLWVSFGGVLGTLFVAVVAPALFSRFQEFPLALFGTCAVIAAGILSGPREWEVHRTWIPLGLIAAIAVLVGSAFAGTLDARLWTSRNFFGAVQVLEWDRGEDTHRYVLRHGRTIHGVQFAREPLRSQPVAYYSQESGLGRAVRAYREARGRPLRFGVLGLGIGGAAALTEPGDEVRFYEIDPAIIALARGQGGFFDYLSRADARTELVEGDARRSLELERGNGARFGVLAVDVFSGDAIPIHLLTREAMALYLDHLEADGILAIHISNSYLDLRPVVVAHAEALGLHARRVNHSRERTGVYASDWMLLSRDPAVLEHRALQGASRLERYEAGEGPRVEWTDERASLLSVLDED